MIRRVSLVLVLCVAACGAPAANVAPVPAPSPSPAPSAPVETAPVDALGSPPAIVPTPPFQPPSPVVYTTKNGMTVWLLERHALPIVSVTLGVPTGSSSDPAGKAGLAEQAGDLLKEGGAGKRGALELARAIDDLGASLDVETALDSTRVHLDALKRNFAPAMQLAADVVARPRLEPGEWKRLHDLWVNDLKERASDPDAVAGVVASAVLYGADHPYGHPVDGLASTAPNVQLADAKRFVAQAWRPDRVTVVAVGDLTKAELDAQLEAGFGSWKAPAASPLPVVTPAPPSLGDPAAAGAKPKIVLVDRPDAPQSVVHLVRPSVDAKDSQYPPLYRANIALGGSFTSRLMQDLREAHGWTYGAHSRVNTARGVGMISVGGSFVTEKTVDALGEMLAVMDKFAQAGLTDDEVAKTRSRARMELVDVYKTVGQTSAVLAHDAALALGPDNEARSSLLSDDATPADLNKLAATFFDRRGATVIVVGSRAALEGPLTQAGYGPIEYRDAEGRVLTGAKKK